MEVIEDGNIMDRIPILLQRDLEYYQSNQTVLSETVCRGVVGGRLDFPRNASFAAVKIVLWLEEEFSIAFQQGSGMFVETEHDVKPDGGVAKTSDPDKFVQLAVKSSDSLLEHLHMLVQEALDHADLPVLTATLGAAALVKNTLYCYVQHVEDSGNSERLATLQACYKRYVSMSEAVGERVLDLQCRVVSLYALQHLGRDKRAHTHGTPNVQGWWLYMNGSRKDLWDTVPPRMAQRIFAGMLNETLTILTVRYCQMNTTESTTPMLINDIVNILLCVSQLLPSICTTGSDLAGLDVTSQAREVRDVHAKCNELFKCAVLRGADIHFIHDAFINEEETVRCNEGPYPWFKFANPALFSSADRVTSHPNELPTTTALGLDLIVLLAQPQPNWNLLVKVLMMRECYLAGLLLTHAVRHMAEDNARWPHDGLWYGLSERNKKCGGFLCTADGFCRFHGDSDPGQEYARAAGALTYVVAAAGNRAELRDTLCAALERAAPHWPHCLHRRQVWCDRRPAWLAAIMALVGDSLKFIPPILVNALQNGASMYQTMSSCVRCLSLWCVCAGVCVRGARAAARSVSRRAPAALRPAARDLLLHVLIAVLYQEMIQYATSQAAKESAVAVEANGQPHNMSAKNKPKKQVRVVSFGNTTTSSSVSVDSSHSCLSSAALAIAEALCSIDEDHKHTSELANLLAQCNETVTLSNKFGLEDFPDFAQLYEEDNAPGSNAERASDAAALTSQILMTSAGRDSLRVIYDHIHLHSERILSEVCGVPHTRTGAPLLYVMFHIGTMPFDQYLRGEWPMTWSKLVAEAKAWCGRDGARAHVTRRDDVRAVKANAKCANDQLLDVYNMFKTHGEGLL